MKISISYTEITEIEWNRFLNTYHIYNFSIFILTAKNKELKQNL